MHHVNSPFWVTVRQPMQRSPKISLYAIAIWVPREHLAWAGDLDGRFPWICTYKYSYQILIELIHYLVQVPWLFLARFHPHHQLPASWSPKPHRSLQLTLSKDFVPSLLLLRRFWFQVYQNLCLRFATRCVDEFNLCFSRSVPCSSFLCPAIFSLSWTSCYVNHTFGLVYYNSMCSRPIWWGICHWNWSLHSVSCQFSFHRSRSVPFSAFLCPAVFFPPGWAARSTTPPGWYSTIPRIAVLFYRISLPGIQDVATGGVVVHCFGL